VHAAGTPRAAAEAWRIHSKVVVGVAHALAGGVDRGGAACGLSTLQKKPRFNRKQGYWRRGTSMGYRHARLGARCPEQVGRSAPTTDLRGHTKPSEDHEAGNCTQKVMRLHKDTAHQWLVCDAFNRKCSAPRRLQGSLELGRLKNPLRQTQQIEKGMYVRAWRASTRAGEPLEPRTPTRGLAGLSLLRRVRVHRARLLHCSTAGAAGAAPWPSAPEHSPPARPAGQPGRWAVAGARGQPSHPKPNALLAKPASCTFWPHPSQ
jgi:hypothetical protein